jgi:hypothetical protein
MKSRFTLLILAASLLTGCFGRVTIIVTATPSLAPQITPTPTAIPTDTPGPTTPTTVAPTPTPITPTALPEIVRVWMSPDVPVEFQVALDPLVKSKRYAWANEAQSDVKLTADQTPSGGLAGQWIYAPVVPFPTIADNVNWADIQRYWKGDTAALASLTGNNQPPVFVAAHEVVMWLTRVLGAPASNVKIEEIPPDGIVTTLWLRRPAGWSIVPFDRLDPAMKVLTLDGASVFNRSLALDKYPLQQSFSLKGETGLVNATTEAIRTNGNWIATNRDLSKMTIMVMTGVTALSRATAYQMELDGITLPARDILPFLEDATFIHTSNEVSFATDCPYPNPAYQASGMRFCSKDSYLDLLKTIKLNIVELTGNHVVDWGAEAFAHTLDIYDANKIGYFGGGRNDQDAKKALIINHNGNSIALIGCNPAGPSFAWAKEDRVGAAKCDDEFLAKEIARLKASGNLVIMTLQYQEYYQYSAPSDQVAFFEKYAKMGADLVMGSQAHQPQGFAFTGTAFIHYGYGNLFFDQMDSIATRRMFADKLILYNGKHLSTVLFTGLIEDYSRPRPMTADERTAFLDTIFKASGW